MTCEKGCRWRENLMGDVSCARCQVCVGPTIEVVRERDKLRAENERLRVALEKIFETADDNLIACIADEALRPKVVLSGPSEGDDG